jgi:ribose transport system permease protein
VNATLSNAAKSIVGFLRKQPSNSQGSKPGEKKELHLVSRFGLLLVLAVTYVIFTIALPGEFLTSGNTLAMLDAASVTILLAGGVTIVLRLRDLDLSFGAAMDLSATAVAVLAAQHHLPAWICVLVGLGVGTGVGIVNAILIVGLGLNSFMATLGMMTIIEGVGYGISGSQVITGLPSSITRMSVTEVGGIQLAVYYGWILIAILWVVYEHTRFGRYLLFIGGNARAARLAGIQVRRTRALAFIVSGAIYGFAGVVLVGTLSAADPSIGGQYLLPPLAAVFLGSTAIQPGRFNAIGTLVGAYLIIIISTGLELIGLASWTGDVFDGLALIAAIGFARLSGRGAATVSLV